MSLQSHLAELERRHDSLKKEIEKEEIRPSVDEIKLHELKRRKLLVKDEIAKLRNEAPMMAVH